MKNTSGKPECIDKVEQYYEDLETIANSDLPASWIAEALLEIAEGDPSE